MALFCEDQRIWLPVCSHKSAHDGDSLGAFAEAPSYMNINPVNLSKSMTMNDIKIEQVSLHSKRKLFE